MRAANQSGGKDNITVVLFRLGDDGDGGRPTRRREDETIAGAAPRPTEVHDVALERAHGAAAGRRLRWRASPTSPPDATIVAPAAGATDRARAAAPPPGPLQDARQTLLALAVLAGIGTGLYCAVSRQVYFVGTNDAGLVTLYRGVPYELPFGVDLYEQEYASGVPARRDPGHPPQARARPRMAQPQRRRGPAAHARARAAVAADVRAHPRAVRADPGVAAGGGRLRRRPGHALARTSATPRSPTARSSSACAWSRTCSSARGCRTPTRTCSRSPRCSPRSGSC